jgi:hypothetical protein
MVNHCWVALPGMSQITARYNYLATVIEVAIILSVILASA